MPGEGTKRFLEILNRENAKIAERIAAEEKAEREGGVDQVREQRQAERRERLGQLRARPRSRKKTRQVRVAFKDNANPEAGLGPND